MQRKFRPGKYALISLAALTTVVVAGGIWESQTRLPGTAQIEQWGVLAGVQDKEATQSLHRAADKGSTLAARALGQVLVLRPDDAAVQEGQRWLQRAAESGDARAQLLLGKLLFKGAPGVPAQALAAQAWFESAFKGGQPGAAHYLGLIHRQDLPGQARSPEASSQTPHRFERMKLVLAWLFVALPLAWGVMQSVKKSLPLFGVQAAATPAK
jgi:TPR repeat protein